MSFDLMRANWPNMAAIAALAALPLVAVALDRSPPAAPAGQVHAAAPTVAAGPAPQP